MAKERYTVEPIRIHDTLVQYRVHDEQRADGPEPDVACCFTAADGDLVARALNELASRDEPTAKCGYQVHVQRNVIGLSAGLDYPANVEHVPFGQIFDTEDAAKLSVAHKGWMDLWWSVRPVNRP